MSTSTGFCRTLVFCGVLLGGLTPLAAQQNNATQPAARANESSAVGKATESGVGGLTEKQRLLADKYRRLEDLLFKMADFESTSNPRRAALLKQAYKQSKDRLTQSQLNTIVKLLSEQKYKRAIDGQEIASKDLQDLLKLLMSEDRSDRLKSEAQKIKEYIKELKRLERLQKGVRGRTENTSDPRQLAKDQERVADRTGDLAEQLEKDDAASQQGKAGEQGSAGQNQQGQKSDQQSGKSSQEDSSKKSDDSKDNKDDSKQGKNSDDPKKSDQKKSDLKKGDQQGKASQSKQSKGEEGEQGDSSQSDQKPSEGSQGKPQKGQKGQSQQSQSGEGKSGESQQSDQQQAEQPQDENPAKKRVREAEEKMREARQKLEEAKRSESVEKQTEALEKLQEAIAELEEILRQLREEEMERVLALLEGRFRKMLEMELKVYEGTLRIERIPVEKRDRSIDIRASKLAFDQRKIAGEADRALTLLLEEGSSIAFPEVVEQMRDDMEEVAARLDQVKVAEITRGLEEEIIATLEELIEALQKAQQDMDEGKQGKPGKPGQNGDPPLVDILAELKMIRSLQVRVNARTRRYARLLDNPDDPVGQAMEADLRRAIGKLSELESRIQQITRDIALGKNK